MPHLFWYNLTMISKEEVQHIAKLARLELTEPETENMQKELSAILDYFDVLKKVPQNNAQIHTELKGKNILRKDEAAQKPASLANNLVQVAPDKKDGYVKVKAIL